ncbi:uncharacterized protein LOC134264763 [Saccostrea cucullata]|uniref:uncharacterized protein LOC134264763 n=1 Tax=Saccostrea cuccullata TaxID=36930 RepID=UPI002ED15AD0
MHTPKTPDVQIHVSAPETWPVVLAIAGSFLILSTIVTCCLWRYVKKLKRKINPRESQTNDNCDKTIETNNTHSKSNMKRNAIHPIDVYENVHELKPQLHPLDVFTRKGKPLPLARVSPTFLPESRETIKSIKSHNDIFNIYKSSVNDPHLHRTGRRVSNAV